MVGGVPVSPVPVVPVGAVSAATLLWRHRGYAHVTINAKATFALVHREIMTPIAAEPIDVARDHLPFRPQIDVVVMAAHACAPRPVEAAVVGLAVQGATLLVDKSLLVYAPRPGGVVAPFTEAAIVKREGRPEALVVNPADPTQRGSFGPRDLTVAGVGYTPNGVMTLDDRIDWSELQIAPRDQRVPSLRGDEWLVLKGMFPDALTLKSRLPGASIETRIYAASMWAGRSLRVAMFPDVVAVDADQRACSIVWRGGFTVADESTAREITAVCALALEDIPVVWPTVAQVATSAALQAQRLRVGGYATTQREVDEDAKQRELEASIAARIQELGALALRPMISTVELDTRGGEATQPPPSQNPQELATVGGVVYMRPMQLDRLVDPDHPSQTESGTLDLPPDPNELAPPAPLWLGLFPVPGTPWAGGDLSRRAPGGTIIAEEPADLPDQSVDALEHTLSDSLIGLGAPPLALEGVRDRLKKN